MESSDHLRTGLFELLGFASPRLDVHWEPTPPDVVQEMLKIADVTSADVVYDLGCGDGRIVIAAARDRGARAVGVDLDPRRIRECRENAARADMTHAVQFIHADLFTTDFSDATVLMLFLFPDVNLRLRPRVLAELQPGTRVVSYCHTMGRWEPDAIVRLKRNAVYFWIVPANVTGVWEGKTAAKEAAAIRLEFQQEFQKVTGTVEIDGRVLPITNGRMKGRAFSCTACSFSDGNREAVVLNGTVEGDAMEGTLRRGLSREERAWTAVRDPSTIISVAQ
jgi:SAM-dependent methyltransferase